MKNHTPGGRGLRFSTGLDRVFVIALTLVFAGLVWAAMSGRFDRQIDQGARWLSGAWESAVAWVRRVGD